MDWPLAAAQRPIPQMPDEKPDAEVPGMACIAADRPPGDADFADLPMPRQVWDT